MRYLNVTVGTPDGFVASPVADWESKAVIFIEQWPTGEAHVIIDANTGTIIDQRGTPSELAAMQSSLDTVRVSAFDAKEAPWPYANTSPSGQKGSWGNISYTIPDPLTGISVGQAAGDGGASGACGYTIIVDNGRSRMVIDACSGKAIPGLTAIHVDDADAFNRFLAVLEVEP